MQDLGLIPGIGNLNDGITQLEGMLLNERSNEENEEIEKKKQIQYLIVKIEELKRRKNKPFF